MSDTVIKVDSLWKQYQLGAINHGTLSRDLQSWWARLRGKEDPNLPLDLASQRAGSSVAGGSERFWALHDVSFEVKRGEIVGIIGCNGAGKSTLLKILSQVTTPTRGEVRINGRIASLLEVGTGFHPELTGKENIFLNGAILGMNKAEIRRKLDEIIAFAEVEKFIDTPVKRYSSGMYVRLAFAVAAHLDPEILIIDEVLAVGDVQFQKKCLGKMEEVGREGRTVLFVSHNMPSVKALCGRALLIEKGSLSNQGEVDSVVKNYLLSIDSHEKSFGWLENAKRSAGKIRAIKSAWLEEPGGTIVSKAIMGNPITLCFSYELDQIYAALDFGFGVESKDGERIFSVNNTITKGTRLDVPLRGVACCEIKKLPLLPGNYLISLSIVDNQEWIDYVERAIYLDVCATDIFGTGKIYDTSQGVIYTDALIKIKNQ